MHGIGINSLWSPQNSLMQEQYDKDWDPAILLQAGGLMVTCILSQTLCQSMVLSAAFVLLRCLSVSQPGLQLPSCSLSLCPSTS